MNAASDPTDAQLDGYLKRRAGRPLSVSESNGQAADQWASYDTARRRAHIGELHEITRLRTELELTRARLAHAEHAASLFADHLKGCVPTTAETAAVIEWEHAARIQPVPDDSDDYPRAGEML